MALLHTIRLVFHRIFPGADRFVLDDDCIVASARHYPVRRIPLKSIESWTAYPEMTFDILDIRLVDGSLVRWLDVQNDLLSILHDRVSDREINHDLAEPLRGANRRQPPRSV